MKCPACDRSVADGARFCAYCGAFTGDDDLGMVPFEARAVQAMTYWVCRSCHVENKDGDAYCGSCGAPRPSVGPPLTSSSAVREREPGRTEGLPAAIQTTHAASLQRSRRRLTIAALSVAVVAVTGLIAVLVVQWSAPDAPTALSEPLPSQSAAVAAIGTSTPAPPQPSPADSTPTTWPGISGRPEMPFWGAFYCAGSNKTKAIQAAQVGRGAGWRTLVLWTGDYASFGSSGKDLWAICAGPYDSRSEAQDVVEQMDAGARELRSVSPELDIHFGRAYVKLVQ